MADNDTDDRELTKDVLTENWCGAYSRLVRGPGQYRFGIVELPPAPPGS